MRKLYSLLRTQFLALLSSSQLEGMARFLKVLDFSTHHDQTAPAEPNIVTPAALKPDDNVTEQRFLPVASLTAYQGGELPTAQEQARQDHQTKVAKAVRLLWCDAAGIRRCRVIPGRRYANSQCVGVGIAAASMGMPAFADVPVSGSGLSAVGEARLKPVESTRVDVPWHPGHQMALVEFEAPRSLDPWDYCPRNALKKTCKMLLDDFGLTLKVGFEVEFLLLERAPLGSSIVGEVDGSDGGGGGGGLYGTGWRPVDNSLYCQSSALDRHAKALDDMTEALERLGIEVLQWHPESAHGQFEIALGYSDPVDSADKLLFARETLVGVAASHRLAVSFLPKPIPGAAGSACHMHLSLWKDGKIHMHISSAPGEITTAAAGLVVVAAADASVTAAAGRTSCPGKDPSSAHSEASISTHEYHQHQHQHQHRQKDEAIPPGAPPRPIPIPSPEMLSFLAGILTYLEVLLPFTAPSPNSYARMVPGAWAGAHTAWGYNNRETPLRVTAPGPGQLALMHVEYKAMDNTANPYLALSSVIVAGMLGLFTRQTPPEPCQVAPQDLDDEAAARLGVRRMPADLQEALTLMESRKGETFKAAMTEAIGANLLKAYLAVRQAEAQQAPNDKLADLLLRYT